MFTAISAAPVSLLYTMLWLYPLLMSARRGDMDRSPGMLGDLLDSVLGRFGLRNRIRENEVFLVWEEAVGELVSKHSRPRSITDGILVVETRDNVWMQELSMLRLSIAEKINELLGWEAVKELRFRIGPLKERSEHRQPARVPAKKEIPELKTDPENEREIQAVLTGIDDPELKKALRSMMIRGLKREKR